MSVLPLVHLGRLPMVAIDIGAWAIIHAGTGYAAHRLSVSFCDHDNVVTRLRRWETSGRLWRVTGVHAWKDRLPEAGDVFAGGVSKRHLPSTASGGLRAFAALTRRAEMGHWMAVAASPVFFVWNPVWIGWVMIGYAIAVNAPFIAIQRYNRSRIMRIEERRALRAAATARAGAGRRH